MDLGTSFSFLFQDEEWVKKLLIGSLLVFLGFITFGILLLPVIGWAMEIGRRVIAGEEEPLPDWTDFGTLFVNGLKAFAALLVWSLPIILVSACLAGLSALAGEQFASPSDAGVFMWFVSACLILISFVYAFVIAALSPALLGKLAEGAPFGEAINPAQAFKLFRANVGGFLLASILGSVIYSILSPLGTLLCLIGVFPAIVYGYAVWAHMIGQAYKQAKEAAPMLAAA